MPAVFPVTELDPAAQAALAAHVADTGVHPVLLRKSSVAAVPVDDGQVVAICLHTEDPTALIKAALRRGYSFIWASELRDALDGKVVLPPRAVLLMYDDVRSQMVSVAAPVIAAYGVKCTAFVCSDYVSQLAVDASLPGVGPTWAQLQTLHATGLYEWQNHTKTHISLTSLSSPDRIAHLNACSDAVVANLGVARPTVIAYPNGNYNSGTIADLRTVGITVGFDFAAGGKSLTQRFSRTGEGRYLLNRATPVSGGTAYDAGADATLLRHALQDVFHSWENDATGGVNDANVLGYWTFPAVGGSFQSSGEAVRLDSRVEAGAHAIISADYFKVRPGETIYSRFFSQSELQTAGNAGIRIAQYDAAQAFISNIDLKSYAAAAGFTNSEAESALAATCRYIRIEIWADAAYDGLVQYKNGVVRRAAA